MELAMDSFNGVNSVNGVISVNNAIWLIATLMIIIGIGATVFNHLVPLIKNRLSIHLLEILGYLSASLFIHVASIFSGYTQVFVALFGSLLFGLTMLYSMSIHLEKESECAVKTFYLICTVVWYLVAVKYQSELIGWFAVTACTLYTGLTVMVVPGCYLIGYENDSVLIRGTSAAAVLLITYIQLAIFDQLDNQFVFPFCNGILVICGCTYFIGMLILSNYYYYDKENLASYPQTNLLSVLSGLGMIGLGSTNPNLYALYPVGAAFLVLFFANKYLELPWGERLYDVGLLVGGCILYGICYNSNLLI